MLESKIHTLCEILDILVLFPLSILKPDKVNGVVLMNEINYHNAMQ